MPLDNRPAGRAPYEDQGATLLSRQPLTLPDSIPRLDTDWQPIFQHLERRLAGMRTWRWTWWETWMSLAEFFLPRRAKAWIIANSYNRGLWLNQSIIDTSGSKAALDCGAGMWSGLTNPSRPWFAMEPARSLMPLEDQPADARKWLTETAADVATVLHQSNFYNIMSQFFQDETVFGTAPLICYEDQQDVVRFTLPCIGEYFLAASSRMDVNTLYREFVLTTVQLVEMFGLKNCPEVVRTMFRTGGGQLDQEFIVAHAIEPNFPIEGARGEVRGVPSKYAYREFYWLRGRQTGYPLSRRGFFEKPFAAGRWTHVSNDPYGRGPGMDALGDQKQVQLETRRKAEFLEKGVRPPMVASPELKNEPQSVMPGMVTFVNSANGNAGFRPAFEVQAIWLQHMTADIKDVNQRIKEIFYIPQFMAITQMQGVQPRNELELTKRDLEKLQILGPVISNTEQDVLSPMIQRVVSIMLRKGMIPPPPPSLRGVPLKITYNSLMRMAQRAAETVSMKDGFQTMGFLSSAAKAGGFPDPARIINWDRSGQRYLLLNNYPADLIYSPDEIAQHDQMRMQENERARQQEMASQLSDPAVKAAGILSQTPVQGDSMLNAILTGQTG